MALTASTYLGHPLCTPFDKPASQLLNEIMPMIYKRFTEKAAEEWRQIYKVLTLWAMIEGLWLMGYRACNFSNSLSRMALKESLTMPDRTSLS